MGLGFPAMAKVALAVVLLVIVGLVALVRFVARRRWVRRRRASQVSS